MNVLVNQAHTTAETLSENRKPAGKYGMRPYCRHARAAVSARMIHSGSIFAESGPDWEEMLYCPDCDQPIYNPRAIQIASAEDLDQEFPF